ncbi:MAG: asparagine synthetase B family protein, partial [Nitrospinota bacterium]
VAMMSRMGGARVKTFSIGSEEERYNELPYARLVAERFETEHHEFIVKPDAIEVLPRLIWHFNEPFADSSALPSFYLAQMTRSHVTVALNGDAGDENFGGYERYVAAKLAGWLDILPRGVRARLLRPLIGLLPGGGEEKSATRRLRRFLEALLLSRERRYARWASIMDDEFKSSLYSEALASRLAQRDAFSHILKCYEEVQEEAPDFIDATILVDINSYLPDDLLVKMDIMTMAHSLEARSPFLDHPFMEFAARIPSSLKVRGKTTKYLLRKALGELLPREVLERGKMGFGVPIGRWFRRELKDWVREILLDGQSLGRDYFRRKALEGIISEHAGGLRDNGFLLWNLLNLELWHRQFIDSAPRAARAALATPEVREGS